MAEGRTVNTDNVICRFFAISTCRDGDKCPLSHDTSHTLLDKVCRFYLQGRCYFGNSCRYDHVRLKPSASPTNKAKNETNKHQAGPSRNFTENSQAILPRNVPLSKQSVAGQNSMQTLKNQSQNFGLKKGIVDSSITTSPCTSDWVNAPVFVPKAPKSYADTLKSDNIVSDTTSKNETTSESDYMLCPYFVTGDCPYEDQCGFIHGDICELCGKACLVPEDKEQQKAHVELCEKELEQDMELSFAVQRSLDKTCGICMDLIMEKEPSSERRFGILEKCNHVFCLGCIRKWRKVKHFETSQHIDTLDPVVTRACPECRVASDFITPSQYWVDTEEEKTKLIKDYKEALSKKPCKYFQQGRGECPFAGACFYLHAHPDGSKVDLPPPRRRRRQNQNGDVDFMDRIYLWDFLELREDNIFMQFELEDLLYELSDSEDDSEMSVNFLFDESL